MEGNRSAGSWLRSIGAVAAVMVTIGGLVAACGSDAAPTTVSPAGALTAIVDWQVSEQTPVVNDKGEVELPVIYIARSSGDTIDVGAQANVVSSTAAVATVRFADDSSEALDTKVDGEPVKDNGVLLVVGETPEPARSVEVAVRRYTSVDDEQSFTLRITSTPDGPTVTSAERD